MSIAPSLFISHGAPTFALQPGRLGASLRDIGEHLPAVTAVLVVSPHWQTPEVRVMTGHEPATIHDFGGFAAELYELSYPAPGHPVGAAEAGELLAAAGYPVRFDEKRGFDHGAWVPLMHLFPDAKLPVFQVSMPHSLDTAGALRLGATLAPLRRRGVLILASGSLTHNLYELRQPDSAAAPYAAAFAEWVREAVIGNDVEALIGYRRLAPQAERAHPTEEHFLPLLVALGAAMSGEQAQVLAGDMTYGVIAMESYAWGMQGLRSSLSDLRVEAQT